MITNYMTALLKDRKSSLFAILIILSFSSALKAQDINNKKVYLGREKDNRLSLDSANRGYRIIRQYDHPYQWLNLFSFKSYTRNRKPSCLSKLKKSRRRILISFKSGFDDHAEVYLNDSLIFKKYLRTQPSLSSTLRSTVVMPQINGSEEDIVILKLIESGLYLQFQLNDQFDYVKIYCDKTKDFESWSILHNYYGDKRLVNSSGKSLEGRIKILEQNLYRDIGGGQSTNMSTEEKEEE